LGSPVSFLVVGQGVIATRQLQEAISGVLFCDFSRHSAELSGEPSKVLGISEMIHLFSAFSPKTEIDGRRAIDIDPRQKLSNRGLVG
jgi:hypothetical protein